MAQQADLELVTKVLLETTAYPAGARQMLLEGLPHALLSTGERHEYQADFARLAQDALQDALRWAQGKEAAFGEGVHTAEAQLKEKKAALVEAAAREEAAHAELKAKTASHAEAHERAQEAALEHREIEQKNRGMLAARSKLREEKAAAAAIIEGSLRMLVDGGWSDDEMKSDAVAAVDRYLVETRAENVLVAAAPSALSLRPEARRAFDTFTVESVAQVLQAHADSLETKFAEGAAVEKEVWAETLGLWALLDVARDRQVAEKTAQLAAKADLEAAAEAHRAAVAEVSEQEAALSKYAAEQTLYGAKVEEITEALAGMERLIAHVPHECDVEMAEEGEAEEKAEATGMDVKGDIPAAEADVKAGNPLGVPTPMVM